MLDSLLAFIAGFVLAAVTTITAWFAEPELNRGLSDEGTTSAQTVRISSPQDIQATSSEQGSLPVASSTPSPSRASSSSVASSSRVSAQPTNISVVPIVSPQEPTKRMPGTFLEASEVIGFPSGGLDAREIFRLTNDERARVGLAPLLWSPRLAAMAEAKNVDMITRQYFAHVSPNGKDIGDLADTYGYLYRRVGENLALGDFASSSHVVTGWMRSPGHRENILEPEFTELGVSVMRGAWEGREVWWATQEFGRPMPDCPEPDELLRKKIEIFDEQLSALKETLDGAKRELDDVHDPSLYRTKVEEYNLLVDLFNNILETQKSQIAAYNASVGVYNACIGE